MSVILGKKQRDIAEFIKRDMDWHLKMNYDYRGTQISGGVKTGGTSLSGYDEEDLDAPLRRMIERGLLRETERRYKPCYDLLEYMDEIESVKGKL